MPSWQARVVSLGLRLFFKRRPTRSEDEMVAFLRARLESQRLVREWLTPEANVQQVSAGEVRGEWVRASARQQATIYYLHGGGYVACSPATHRSFTVRLSERAAARVFALDYRLAPEHRFPAAVEDAVAGYRWLLAQGIAPQEIVIGGDSAGGGLTVATLVALREANVPLPCAAFCLSPWTDLAATGASLDTNSDDDPMFYGATVRRAAPIYLGQAAPDDPLASPLYADLRGLPPLLIYVSDTEVLLDDARRLAERAQQGGVKVDLRVWEDLPHVWPIFVALRLPEAREAVEEIAQFIHAAVTTASGRSQAASAA